MIVVARMLAFLLISLFVLNPTARVAPSAAEASSDAWNKASLVGGTVRALVIDATTFTTVYAATGRSVFRTTNSGGEWQPILTSSEDMTALAVDGATTPPTLFAASRRQVWRSENGGQTWDEISSGLSGNIEVLKVAADSRELWAGTTTGAWRYVNGWRATGSGPIVVRALAFSPTVVYAGSDAGLFRSTNNGTTWTYSAIGGRIIDQQNIIRSIAVNPVDPHVVVVGTSYGGIHISAQDGEPGTWREKVSSPGISMFGYASINDLAYVKSDYQDEPPILYAATDTSIDNGDIESNDQGKFARSGVFRLDTDNINWEPVSEGLSNTYVTRLAAHPTLPGTLYAGTIGSGIWLKTGTTSNWVQQSAGMNALTVREFVRSGSVLYAATNGDGVHQSLDNGVTWTRLGRGLPRIENNVASLLVDTNGTVWLGHTRSGLYRLNGDNWVAANRTLFGAATITALASANGGLIAAYRVVAGTGAGNRGVKISFDRGANWLNITNGLPANLDIRRFVGQRTNNGIAVWAATTAGVYHLLPTGERWGLVGASAGLDLNDVRTISVDPNNANILYAVGNSVYKSINGGTNWSPMRDGLQGLCCTTHSVSMQIRQTAFSCGVWLEGG